MPQPTLSLFVHAYDDANEAVVAGWHKNDKYKNATILRGTHAVIVRNGTVQGNPTVDLVLEDAAGRTYVVMTTGRLLRSLPL